MKIEAFINAPSWPFGNYLLHPYLLVVRGVASVARRVLAQSLPCIAACRASGSLGAVQSRGYFE
jgi:hypothetical protein